MKKISLWLFIITSCIVFLFDTLTACNPAKNIPGTYHSKFAVGGFFATIVVLNPDSTFTYRKQGDLFYDTAAGKYQVEENYLIFNYTPLAIDTTKEHMNEIESLSIHENMTGSQNLHAPKKYIIRYNKLFLTNKDGLKVNRQWAYSKCKKYFLFGSHWYYKRYYLKRVD